MVLVSHKIKVFTMFWALFPNSFEYLKFFCYVMADIYHTSQDALAYVIITDDSHQGWDL